MFRAIGTATELAQAQLAAKGGPAVAVDTDDDADDDLDDVLSELDDVPSTASHTLARGLCKTYATAGNMVWYTGVRDQLQKVATPLAASSPKAAAEAFAAIKTWLKEAPKEETDAVFTYGYNVSSSEALQRLATLSGTKP
jgi:hypothetical protein